MDVDVAVVGGGIAGMSLAGELSRSDPHSERLRVVVLEQEAQLAYHATGRSAAAFLESYGSPEIRALTRASRPLFDAASAETATPPLLTPRPLIWVAPEDQVPQLEHLLATEPVLRPASEDEARAMFPALRPGWTAAAAIEDGAQDLDVAGLFELYRRRAIVNGVGVLIGARTVTVNRDDDGWLVQTLAGDVRARHVVNAAGAWADEFAARCGIPPLNVAPFRRTVAVASSSEVDRGWPLVADVAQTFYFRPEGTGLLVSPADETPTGPCDAKPEMEDVALALDRANEATTLNLRHVQTAWAGLRTFSPDRNPVIGFDESVDGKAGFFWLAGLGGYGMQTAPAIATLAAALIRDEPIPPPLAAEGLDPGRLSPTRFR